MTTIVGVAAWTKSNVDPPAISKPAKKELRVAVNITSAETKHMDAMLGKQQRACDDWD